MLDGYVGSTIAFLPTAWAGKILKWTEGGDDLEGSITPSIGALKGLLVGGRSLEYVLTTSDHWELCSHTVVTTAGTTPDRGAGFEAGRIHQT